MALKTLIVDGIEHLIVLDRSSNDGGLVINYFSPNNDGTHANIRYWFQDPSLAQAEFDKADVAISRKKRDEALKLETAIVEIK